MVVSTTTIDHAAGPVARRAGRVNSSVNFKARVTINILPDDVLLHIFRLSWRWDRLVHVCRRWRSIVFGSPTFLDLRLVCGPRTRVELTGIWPPLPIIIRDMANRPMPMGYNFTAIINNHRARVCKIDLLHLTNSHLKRLASAMKEQLPALIHLMLDFHDDFHRPLVLSDGFLGGSAPRLQTLSLRSIPFPSLPNLLMSATDLVRLTLWNIPHSGYFSPDAIVTSLAVLTNLASLTIDFESPLSHLNRERRRPPPQTRTVLPALTRLGFKGASEYLEYLVAFIESPRLESIWITLFYQLIFDIPQFSQFMARTTMFQDLNEAHVFFDDSGVQVGSHPPKRTFSERSRLRISCSKLNWQLSSAAQVVTTFFPSIYKLEHLYIYGPHYYPSLWGNNIENMEWLEIIRPFTAVKNFYVSEKFTQCIAPALQELVKERVTEVLPALERIFLENFNRQQGSVQNAIMQFIDARRLLGHHGTILQWDMK